MRARYMYLPLILFFGICTTYLSLSITGCGADGGSLYMAAMGLNEGRILVANSVAAPASKTITMYDLSGNFISVVLDKTVAGDVLRGLAQFDPYNIILSTDTPDELKRVNIFTGQAVAYANNALFTGNIYDTVKQADGVYLTVESNTIEKFVGGSRAPAAGNPYINTTLGACTISTARGLTLNTAGELIATSFTNARILRYDVSSSTSVCSTSIAAVGTQPVPIVSHPNGMLYFGTQGAPDTIYEVAEDLSGAPTAILADANIDNPVAMAVLPSGNLLVANDTTDAIIEITTAGMVVNSSFIKNAFTGTISAILVIPPQ